MNILYIDAISGISGNMFIGAMLDLIGEREFLEEGLSMLDLKDYTLEFKTLDKKGISANFFDVNLDSTYTKIEVTDRFHEIHRDEDVLDIEKSDFSKSEEHSHHHHEHSHRHHEQDHHHHHDSHCHSHGKEHHHGEHRNYRDIEKIIKESGLSDFVKEKSLKIFEYIAHAEGKIHNKAFDEVHFHEVGAIDSIIDAVGAALCVEKLNPQRIMASDIPLGSGFVNCAHGKFPLPAPATMEILASINAPVYQNSIEAELTTPTGAAILAAFVDEFGNVPPMIVNKSVYGAGTKDLEIPNVLRLYYGKKKV